MKPLYESQINVGLLECNTPERYEALGRLVVHCLMRSEAERKQRIGKHEFTVRQVVVHGT